MLTLENYLARIETERGDKIRAFHVEHRHLIDEAFGSGHNHQAWKGGYRQHLEQCMFFIDLIAVQALSRYFSTGQPSGFTVDNSGAIIVLYFHDIEKMYKYSRVNCIGGFDPAMFDKWSFYTHVLPVRWQIEFTPDELIALKYVHGEGDDYSKTERKMNRLGAICHAADIISSRVLFDKGDQMFVEHI